MAAHIPADWPVRPVPANTPGAATCGACGRSWDDTIPTGMTPTPAGRCPFEMFHDDTPPTAWGRSESDPCQRGTVGCSVDHVGHHAGASCETW